MTMDVHRYEPVNHGVKIGNRRSIRRKHVSPKKYVAKSQFGGGKDASNGIDADVLQGLQLMGQNDK